MKNIVFIPFIDNKDGRTSGYQYGIESWRRWCDTNNCTLILFDTLILPVSEMKVTWQRYFLFDLLEESSIDYDQILMVDCDTVIHPECPNFFQESEGKYCGVVNDGSYEWTIRGIENYSKHVFSGYSIPWHNTINGGFQIVNKKHKPFFDYVKNFYLTNKELFLKVQKFSRTGSDQIPLNFLLDQQNIEIKHLPYYYNMMEMQLKEIVDRDFLFTKLGWVYHFNAGLPAPPTGEPEGEYWMRETYKYLYNEA